MKKVIALSFSIVCLVSKTQAAYYTSEIQAAINQSEEGIRRDEEMYRDREYRGRPDDVQFDQFVKDLEDVKKYPVVAGGILKAPYSIMLQDGSLLTPRQAVQDGAKFYSSQTSIDVHGTINTAIAIDVNFTGWWDKRTTQEAAGLKVKDGKKIVITAFDATQPVGSDGGTWFYTNYCMAYYLVYQYLNDTTFKGSIAQSDAQRLLQVLENLYHLTPLKQSIPYESERVGDVAENNLSEPVAVNFAAKIKGGQEAMVGGIDRRLSPAQDQEIMSMGFGAPGIGRVEHFTEGQSTDDSVKIME